MKTRLFTYLARSFLVCFAPCFLLCLVACDDSDGAGANGSVVDGGMDAAGMETAAEGPAGTCTDLPATIDTALTVGPGCVRANRIDIRGGGRLTIQPGTNIVMAAGGNFDVGTFAGGGAVVAIGTAAAPIKFTSASASPLAGDWQCVYLGSGSTDSEFKFVTFEYGGALCNVTGSSENLATVIIKGGIRGITDSAVTDSLTHGIKIENEAGIRAFQNNRFARNGKNGEASLWVATNELVTLGAPNTFEDTDDYIRIDTTFAAGRTGTWQAHPVPYRAAKLAIHDMAQITVAPGAKIQMMGGSISVFRGNLILDGTASAPVTITSANPSPMPGDWGCIEFSSVEGSPTFRNAIIEYGGNGSGCTGANYRVALFMSDEAPQFTATQIRNIAGAGVRSSLACEAVRAWCPGLMFSMLATSHLECSTGGMAMPCP